jgi:hypothetical protein
MDRRQFMAALGLGTGSLMLPSRSAAAEVSAPKRFLLFYTAQGGVPERWQVDPEGLGEGDWDADWTQWSWKEFGESFRPLRKWSDQISAVSGLGLVSAQADGSAYRHERMQAHGLSGAMAKWHNGYPLSGGPSVDQIIAEHLSRPDRYRSLELSVGRGLHYGDYGSAIYRGPGQPLPTIDDPQELWDRLFGLQAADPVLGRQGSVLDAVAQRYERLGSTLSAEDQRKLQVHQDMVRDLERRLAGVQDAVCQAPERPGQAGQYEADFESHLGLLAAAFSCDLTRVASIQMGQLSMEQLGLGSGDVHNELAHDIYNSVAAANGMSAYTAHHAKHFSRILEVLDGVPEGDGSVLDNTVVAWIPELADSWHGMDRFPIVLGGGRNTRLRTGRYVNLARTSAMEHENGNGQTERHMGVPHQRALVSICQALDVDVDVVGETSLTGSDGSHIDCTGPLLELLK